MAETHITVQELLNHIRAAQAKMSERNPHRILLGQCEVAIIYLSSKVPDESIITRSGIILP